MSTEGINQDQLDIQNSMLEVLRSIKDELGNVKNAMGAQTAALREMRDSTAEVTESMESGIDTSNRFTEALEQNTGGADGLAGSLGRSRAQVDGFTGGLEDAADGVGKLVGGFGILAAAVSGVNEAFNAAKLTGALFTDGITSLTSIVTGAIGVVGSFFSGIMSAASNYHKNSAGAIMGANESIRESFGNLEKDQGAAVKGMAKNLDTYRTAVAAAGTSVFNTIGDMSKVLAEVQGVAEGFGNSFVRLQDQVVGATSEIFLMKKGMNLGADAMKQMAAAAEASGTTLQEKMQESMVTAAHLSNQFDVDVKMIGKNFDQMAADVDNFGHLAPKTLMATATYAAKLGVEVKSLTGLMQGFDTFESAAQNAGKLAEAF